MALEPGLNIVGYLRAEVGVGEAARLLTLAVERTGIPFVTIPYARTRSRQEHSFEDRGSGEAPFDTTILCVNADQVANFAADAGPGFFEGRSTIGAWMWEVEPFPETMFTGFDFVDEVWAASDHAAAAIAAVSPKPVFAVPPPIVAPPVSDRSRADLGLPEGFVFLFVFDFLSVFERKNPLGLIEAFTRAFPGHGPTLVVKSINGDKRPDQLERLREAAPPNVLVTDGYLSPEDKNALLVRSDVYVSLHRSEGFGLTMAEAMALGTPVIATGYSGNLMFMDDANSTLIPYRLTEIPPGCRPYPAGGVWAEPDLDTAAAAMRGAYEAPEEARAKARRALEDIAALHAPQARAPMIADRLERVRGWRARAERLPFPATIPDPTRLEPAPDADRLRGTVALATSEPEQLVRAETMLTAGPKAEERARMGAGARAFRRALFRVLRPYERHQRRVAAALAASIRDLHRRQQALAAAPQTIVWVAQRIGRLQGEIGRLRLATDLSADDLAARLQAVQDELASTASELAEMRRRLEERSAIP